MAAKVMRTPRSLDLEITSQCNASCSYCYYLNNPHVNYTDLPTAAWLHFFEELGRCQVMDVTLQGGEPLLREDFFTLVDAIVTNRMRFSILTNGSQLTPEVAQKIKKTGRCNQVQISLDGSCAEIHESRRGPGTFAPALAAVHTLLDHDLPATVRVTVHPDNIEDLPHLAKLLLEDLDLPSFSTNASAPLGDSAKYTAGAFLDTEQRLTAMRVLADLEHTYPGRILAAAGPLGDWHMFNEMEDARLTGKGIPGRGRLVGCGCTYEKLAVRSDGAIIPCVMLPQLVLGHINDVPLADIWQSAPILNQLRQRGEISLADFDECADCLWRAGCTGNCPGTAWAVTGVVDQPCPFSCYRRFNDELKMKGLTL